MHYNLLGLMGTIQLGWSLQPLSSRRVKTRSAHVALETKGPGRHRALRQASRVGEISAESIRRRTVTKPDYEQGHLVSNDSNLELHNPIRWPLAGHGRQPLKRAAGSHGDLPYV